MFECHNKVSENFESNVNNLFINILLFRAKDILNIDIILTPEGTPGQSSKVVVRKPVPKRAGRSVSESSPHANVSSLSKKLTECQVQDTPTNGKINSKNLN